MKNIIATILFLSFILTGLLIPADGKAFLGLWEKYQKVDAQNGIINIPVNSVNDGQAHYFTYNNNGQEIKFFILKSRDGIIRAAFDACDVCFPNKKGYTQSGEFMVCNNCGQRFHSSKINVIQGGCNPAPVRRTVKDDQLVITAADIITGARYF